jgi:hypothetical protein
MRLLAWLGAVGAFGVLAASACGGATAGIAGDAGAGDAAAGDSASSTEEGGAEGGPSSCESLAWPDLDGGRPSWASGECPEAGCPSGSMCVQESVACCSRPVGCAPVSCGCSVCGGLPCVDAGSGIPAGVPGPGVVCETPTQSRRSAKTDIEYVDDPQREALAEEALEMRLARYRYKDEPETARRRLGFLIDDQRDPSPAVLEDRAHVDQYGYASMLLATVQTQEKEIRALRERLDRLERPRRSPPR